MLKSFPPGRVSPDTTKTQRRFGPVCNVALMVSEPDMFDELELLTGEDCDWLIEPV